jgi:hypothetical protein
VYILGFVNYFAAEIDELHNVASQPDGGQRIEDHVALRNRKELF